MEQNVILRNDKFDFQSANFSGEKQTNFAPKISALNRFIIDCQEYFTIEKKKFLCIISNQYEKICEEFRNFFKNSNILTHMEK